MTTQVPIGSSVAYVHENEPGRAKLIVLQRIEPDDEDPGAALGRVEADARTLLGWCGLNRDEPVDMAASPQADFREGKLTLRGIVKLAGKIPTWCQWQLDQQTDGDFLHQTIGEVADRRRLWSTRTYQAIASIALCVATLALLLAWVTLRVTLDRTEALARAKLAIIAQMQGHQEQLSRLALPVMEEVPDEELPPDEAKTGGEWEIDLNGFYSRQ